ncbi:hypothetical protein KUTeg_018365 [Tegillarca granosa]|uniref:Kinesin motor domain-containing protein n=1 Tax=Tegillarca granosa TaxID=220873 RepID=A0ABQ9EMH1_TEGGR|nr:hypothetical protein KUTeg_018365 [Tegillarca granosa]
MATKEKIKKKKDVAKLAEQVSLKDERPGSAQSQGSQVSVKEADIKNVTDNTDEKFKQDESKQEKEDNKRNEENRTNEENKSNEERKNENVDNPSPPSKSASEEKKETKQKSKLFGKAEKPDKKTKNQEPTKPPAKLEEKSHEKKKDKDNKIKKKGKEKKDRTPSPAPSLSVTEEQRRTPSPFRNNAVEPTNTLGSNTNLGSAASLKSYIYIFTEAWTDKSDVETWTIKSGEEDSPEQHAYVPYLYAKKCIAGIMNDMKLMKKTHVRIVEDIQVQYKAIEDETQSQFNTYIITLREHYSNKVQTFKQVIDIHRTDLDKKEAYWNEMLASLAERNNRLLRERKTLLIHSKEEIERLEKEKEEQRREYTEELDKANAVVAAAGAVSELELELKQTKDQLEKEKGEVVRLQGLLAAGEAAGASTTTTKERKKSVTKETATKSAVVAAAVVIDKNEKDKMSSERGHMEDERNKINEERLQMDEDRKNFGDERKKWMDEINLLQVNLTTQSKESEEWKAKYESMKSRLEQVATVQAKYQALESQYAALATVVATNESTKQAAEENAKKTQDDKNMMEKEQQNLESEIKKWEKDFKKKNGRPPTEDDKSDSVKEMYVQKEELNLMVTSLDQKLETYKNIEQGKVPDPPQVAPVPVDIKEPEVKTVEINVHVTLFQMYQVLYIPLWKLQFTELKFIKWSLACHCELSNQRDRIRELEVEIANLKAAAVVASASAASSEELENLKTENRELRKDMKKMLKKVENYEEKEKTAMQDPDTRIQTLEEKVTGLDNKVLDLESENEALKDSQEKLTTEKENLMQQVTVLQQQLASGTGSPSVVAAVPVKSSAGSGVGDQECGVIGHVDLVKQLEIKTREVEEKEIQIKELDQRIEEKNRVHQIHKDIPPAGEAVTQKLIKTDEEAKPFQAAKEKDQKAVNSWVEKFKKKHGRDPSNKDRDGEAEKLYKALEDSNKEFQDQKIKVEALKIMKTGDYKADQLQRRKSVTSLIQPEETAVEKIETQMSALDNKVTDLESENDTLKKDKLDLQSKIRKQVDAVEASLIQERAAHDNTKDELENLRKQMEITKEESANQKSSTEAEMDTLKKNMVAEIKARDEALLEKEKSTTDTASTALQNQISELKTKLEASNKNLETQRAANRELEGKVKNNKTEKDKAVKEMAVQMEKKEQQRSSEDKKRISTLERRIKELESAGVKPAAGVAVAATKNEIKRKEKILKELEKKYEIEKKKTERLDENLKTTEDDLKVTKKERDDKENELKKVKAELTTLGAAAKEGIEAATKVKTLESENKNLVSENKVLTENFNSERVLRKKYYNMVEDMKGKIRVYCRARPLSSSELERKNYSVLKSPDEYTIQVDTARGMKEFQFDQVFMEDSTQEKIFEDTHEQKNKYTIVVQAYMLELYNDKLIDLFAKPGTSDEEKMEIKKDKRGLVYVQGSVIKDAHNAKELMALFEEGSKNRHTASTKMNQESSRSHLVIGITMESTNKTTGQVLKGKLSLVDLAGSERVGKTGATADQLKEAMSINKSLSALGDVISALSSEQQFIPYRNNKLTMLMQDSMGGNAKTLMFVNISPADYNQEETVISLTYASRVKLITNDASKNAENKEVARLKAIISKMKKGEVVDEEL